MLVKTTTKNVELIPPKKESEPVFVFCSMSMLKWGEKKRTTPLDVPAHFSPSVFFF